MKGHLVVLAQKIILRLYCSLSFLWPQVDSLRAPVLPPGSALHAGRPECPEQGHGLALETPGATRGVRRGGQVDPHGDAGRARQWPGGTHCLCADGTAGGRQLCGEPGEKSESECVIFNRWMPDKEYEWKTSIDGNVLCLVPRCEGHVLR